MNGQQLPMEVDMGVPVSVISTMTQANLFHSCLLNNTSTILMTYTGDQIPVVGQMKAKESYGEQNAKVVSVCGRRARSKPNWQRLDQTD